MGHKPAPLYEVPLLWMGQGQGLLRLLLIPFSAFLQLCLQLPADCQLPSWVSGSYGPCSTCEVTPRNHKTTRNKELSRITGWA